MRVSMGGPTGLDMQACLEITDALEIDRRIATKLLLAVQPHMLKSLTKDTDDNADA